MLRLLSVASKYGKGKNCMGKAKRQSASVRILFGVFFILLCIGILLTVAFAPSRLSGFGRRQTLGRVIYGFAGFLGCSIGILLLRKPQNVFHLAGRSLAAAFCVCWGVGIVMADFFAPIVRTTPVLLYKAVGLGFNCWLFTILWRFFSAKHSGEGDEAERRSSGT